MIHGKLPRRAALPSWVSVTIHGCNSNPRGASRRPGQSLWGPPDPGHHGSIWPPQGDFSRQRGSVCLLSDEGVNTLPCHFTSRSSAHCAHLPQASSHTATAPERVQPGRSLPRRPPAATPPTQFAYSEVIHSPPCVFLSGFSCLCFPPHLCFFLHDDLPASHRGPSVHTGPCVEAPRCPSPRPPGLPRRVFRSASAKAARRQRL